MALSQQMSLRLSDRHRELIRGKLEELLQRYYLHLSTSEELEQASPMQR